MALAQSFPATGLWISALKKLADDRSSSLKMMDPKWEHQNPDNKGVTIVEVGFACTASALAMMN
jgi:hypothetical protein